MTMDELTRELLTWVSSRPRTYADVVEAWRSNCPRHPVVDTLIAAIGSSRLRHILNSCEHMVQACSHLVEPLARACTHLWLVGTSRERLGAPCEIAWQVAPLATPEDAECLEHLA